MSTRGVTSFRNAQVQIKQPPLLGLHSPSRKHGHRHVSMRRNSETESR